VGVFFSGVFFLVSAVKPVNLTPQVHLKGGGFVMGTNNEHRPADLEGPARKASVKPFMMDTHTVTNEQFRDFVRQTKYKTEAEVYGWSFVLDYLAPKKVKENKSIQRLDDAKHWLAVPGSWWRVPEGKGTGIKGREKHPVVHISRKDAASYCTWARRRLPTEKEWEFAARGGLKGKQYPWGNSHTDLHNKMNIWQGKFPKENTKEDGYVGTAPSMHFPPNGFGLFQMLGNVWEWTDDEWKDSKPVPTKEEEKKYVLKGGSFLDSADGSFNHRVAVTTRMGNTADSGGHNTGFRCAADAEGKKEL